MVSISTSRTATKPARPTRATRPTFTPRLKASAGCGAMCPELRESGQPFFMVVSFVNPHDIMYADANVPGTPQAQKAVVNGVLTAPPKNSLYSKQWNPAPSPTMQESLSAPGMPAALTDYHLGWSGALGSIPVNRPDMWQVFNDYYLNMIRDTDLGSAAIVEMDWTS